MKNILILETGGTILMETDKNGLSQTKANSLEQRFSQLHEIANLTFLPVFQKDSASFSISDWQTIAEKIRGNYASYDGFVIIHGTDTMAYTASALSFILEGLNKPVILTGSQVPLSELGSDGGNNVINSVRFAAMDIAEVCICFGSRLIRGNKSTKISEFHLSAFETVNCPYLGKIGLDLILKNYHRTSELKRKLQLKSDFSNEVLHIKCFPGQDLTPYQDLIKQKKFRGILIEGFGAGNLSTSPAMQKFLKTSVDSGALTIISTQCLYGRSDYERYVGGNHAKELGCLTSLDMSKETAIVKLMWVLGQTDKLEEAKGLFNQNLANELNPELLY